MKEPPCPCECNRSPQQFCGGCGHRGCGWVRGYPEPGADGLPNLHLRRLPDDSRLCEGPAAPEPDDD